jgi:hypothetical protein
MSNNGKTMTPSDPRPDAILRGGGVKTGRPTGPTPKQSRRSVPPGAKRPPAGARRVKYPPR